MTTIRPIPLVAVAAVLLSSATEAATLTVRCDSSAGLNTISAALGIDAGDLHVRLDERRLETDGQTRTEAPALPANSYSPRHAGTAPVVDSTR